MKKFTVSILIVLIILILFYILLIFQGTEGREQNGKGKIQVDLEDKKYQYLHGMWEFYDGNEEDRLISYVQISNNGGKMNRGGSSYRITLRGLEPGEKYCILMYGKLGDFKVFADGNPIFDLRERDGVQPFTTVTGTCEVLVKSDKNRFSGRNIPPLLFKWDTYNEYMNRRRMFSTFFLGIFLCFFALNIFRSFQVNYLFFYALVLNLRYFESIIWIFSLQNQVPFLLDLRGRIILDTFITLLIGITSVFNCKKIYVLLLSRKKEIQLVIVMAVTSIITIISYPIGYYGYMEQVQVVIYGGCLIYLLSLAVKSINQKVRIPGNVYCAVGMIFVFGGMLIEKTRTFGIISFDTDFILPLYICIFLFMISMTAAEKKAEVFALSIEKKLLKSENERQANLLMISQIQPHFIYNVLLAIKYLCRHNSEEAEDAIVRFSCYLRENINSISTQHPISFINEKKHVQNYLYLEKMRFGDRIRICWDIKEDQFKIPALTLQALVENAIRHGIGKKEEGGSITISTGKYEEYYIITVKDNGVGFDMENEIRGHQGNNQYSTILNLQNRLEIMMGGKLSYQSKKGIGSKATIYIPY